MKREKVSSGEEEGSHKNDADVDAPKRFRGNDENVRLLVPSKVSIYGVCTYKCIKYYIFHILYRR